MACTFSRLVCSVNSNILSIFFFNSANSTCFMADSNAPSAAPLSEKDAEKWSSWVNEFFSENPHLLDLRERIIPWSGGISYSNMVHTDTASYPQSVSRISLLQLIYQHLCAIGFKETAEILERESGHKFQKTSEMWERTSLLLLASAGTSLREDIWAVPKEDGHTYSLQFIEEDFFASPYREDQSTIWKELYDPELNTIYEKDENNKRILKAASLRRIVVYLATSKSNEVSDEELQQYQLIIHSFTSSHHFFEHLMAIFYLDELEIPSDIREELLKNLNEYRSKVLNFINKWVKTHGPFIGKKALNSIAKFCRKVIENKSDSKKYARSILKKIPEIGYTPKYPSSSLKKKDPIIKNETLLFQPSLSILDPEPEEVARQITLLRHYALRAVHSREFAFALGNKQISQQTPTLSEYLKIGRKLKYQIIESIADRPASSSIDRILVIAAFLNSMNNFEDVSWIVKALRSKSLKHVKYLNQKNVKQNISKLLKICGDSPNQIEQYNSAIKSCYDTWSPAIPNLEAEMRSMTLDYSPSFINGLINIEKRRPVARKIAVIYRFQHQEYNFYDITQIQKVISRGPSLQKDQLRAKLFTERF